MKKIIVLLSIVLLLTMQACILHVQNENLEKEMNRQRFFDKVDNYVLTADDLADQRQEEREIALMEKTEKMWLAAYLCDDEIPLADKEVAAQEDGYAGYREAVWDLLNEGFIK